MNCPLCNTPNMTFHYKNFIESPNPAYRGYIDALSCTNCPCTVDIKVVHNEALHNVVNGKRDDGSDL
jgi:hypothetical protein